MSKSNAVSYVMANALLTLDARTDKSGAPPSSPWPSVSPGPPTRTSGRSGRERRRGMVRHVHAQPAVPRSDAGPGHHQRARNTPGSAARITRCSPPATSCGTALSSRKCRRCQSSPVAKAGVDVAMSALCGACKGSALHGRSGRNQRRTRAIMPSCMGSDCRR